MRPTDISPTPITELTHAFWGSKALFAAVELGRFVALAAAFSCLAVAAAAQQQPSHVDVTHCYAGTASAMLRAQDYNVTSLDFRGRLRATEQGGPFDRQVSHCVATGAAVGNGPNRVSGFCEFLASAEDRVVSREIG